MKKILIAFICIISACFATANAQEQSKFVHIDGTNLIKPDGQKLFIMGTNLGNWLNPEGYMFKFKKTTSPHFINEMLCQLVGPDDAADFWKAFKENYITKADIDFIASTGANTIRVPFNYRVFTDEDYMGETSGGDGFALIDQLIEWCKADNLFVVLDMHDAPGGQTGDNIDDSYGYPWLMTSEKSQTKFCEIWKSIAEHYKNETQVLAYELLNEPVAPYFETDMLNKQLQIVYKKGVEEIRKIDKNHIIMLGGAQWNGNFGQFIDWSFDDKIMFTCHRYGGQPTKEAIMNFIDFRDKTGRPMYMGEIGHNTYEWHSAFCKVLKENNIGYTFWPYKMMDGSSFVAVVPPAQWDSIVRFADTNRFTYQDIHNARPNQEMARNVLKAYLEACKFANCKVEQGYINSLLMKENAQEPQKGKKKKSSKKK